MTTETLREFMGRREKEIKQQIKSLREELKELKNAKEAMPNAIGEHAPTARKENNEGPTIKEMVVKILTDNIPKGYTALELIEQIKQVYGKDIARPSLSPQLSRLKNDNTIILIDGEWSIYNEDNSPVVDRQNCGWSAYSETKAPPSTWEDQQPADEIRSESWDMEDDIPF